MDKFTGVKLFPCPLESVPNAAAAEKVNLNPFVPYVIPLSVFGIHLLVEVSVRPNVSSSDQWAYARVNAFLFAVRTGRFRSGKFDRDLLPSGHPLKSDKKD